MKLQEFTFYLGVFTVNPLRLMSYKIEDSAVLDVFQKADSVIDTVFDGDVSEFLEELEKALKNCPATEFSSVLQYIDAWLEAIKAMSLG
jgi:hypothetical protein